MQKDCGGYPVPNGRVSISVVLPVYNAEPYIGDALQSVLNQTYRDIEILVVDDGSTDGTAEIVRSMARTDQRIQMLQQSNAGVAAARNLAIQKSTGEFIALIDADDIWHPRKLEQQRNRIIAAPASLGLVYSWSLDIDDAGQPMGDICVSNIEGDILPTLICHNFLGNSSVPLIRRECFESIGYYDVEYKEKDAQGCEDWDIYLRIAEKFAFAVVPEFHVGYRKSPQSMSSDYQKMARSHALLLGSLQQRHADLPAFLFKISRGNLYNYFARNCNIVGNHKEALHWLRESIRSDRISPFLRLTLYQLFVASMIGLIRNREQQPTVETLTTTIFTAEGESTHELPNIEKKREIKLELLRDRIFHQGISFLYRVLARKR